MGNKKVHTNILKLTLSLTFLLGFSYFMIFADKYQVQVKKYEVSADFLGLQSSSQQGYMKLDQLVIDDIQPGKFTYIVKNGDNFSSIAQLFGTTVSNIKKVNNISRDYLKVGTKLVITQIDGLIYEIDKDTSLVDFTKQYSLNTEDVKDLNSIQDDNYQFLKGDQVFLPLTEDEAKKIGLINTVQVAEKPVPPTRNVIVKTDNQEKVIKNVNQSEIKKIISYMSADEKKTVDKTPATKTITNNPDTSDNSDNGNTYETDSDIVGKPYYYNSNVNNGFVKGTCTHFAALKRPDIFQYVSENRQDRPFGGDAKYRYGNAQKAGLDVGQSPRKGSIIVFSRGGASASAYGHVAIVESVDSANGTAKIIEQNYVGRWMVNERVINTHSKYIIGYIYGNAQ